MAVAADAVVVFAVVHTRDQEPWAPVVVVGVVVGFVVGHRRDLVQLAQAAVEDVVAAFAVVHKMDQEQWARAAVVGVAAASAAAHRKGWALLAQAAVVGAAAASAAGHTMVPVPREPVRESSPSPQCHCPWAAAETAATAACNDIHPLANPCPDARHPLRRRPQLAPPPGPIEGAARGTTRRQMKTLIKPRAQPLSTHHAG